jgi:hypothetical protein
VKLLAAILLAFLLTSQHVLADAPPLDETPPTDEALPVEGEEQPPVEDNPEHRLRPKTDKEEEAYKKRVVREDPFLNAPPGPEAGELAFYRPIDWLRFEAPLDRATYLTQDSSGQMRGFLTIYAEPQANDAGLLHVVLDYASPQKHVELWLETKALRPRSVTKLAPANAQPEPLPIPTKGKKQKKVKKQKGQPPVVDPAPLPEPSSDGTLDGVVAEDRLNRTRIEYLFDRVTIEREAGIVTTQERMRQLPYSYDVEQLPLLVRQLDFSKLEHHWPFEALLTDPEHRKSLPLQIAEPKETSVTTAEPQQRACYELKLRVGDNANWTCWVERSAPYRLVKFTDSTFTYTLHQYDAAPGSY